MTERKKCCGTCRWYFPGQVSKTEFGRCCWNGYEIWTAPTPFWFEHGQYMRGDECGIDPEEGQDCRAWEADED